MYVLEMCILRKKFLNLKRGQFLQPGPLTLVVIRWQERAKSGLLITDRKWQLIEERYNIISGGSFKMHRSFFLSFKLAMMAPLPDRWRHHLSIDDILLSLKLLSNVVMNLLKSLKTSWTSILGFATSMNCVWVSNPYWLSPPWIQHKLNSNLCIVIYSLF